MAKHGSSWGRRHAGKPGAGRDQTRAGTRLKLNLSWRRGSFRAENRCRRNNAANPMKTLTAKDPKCQIGLIDFARAEPVAKNGPPVVVMAVAATSAAVRADRGLREIQGH